MVTINDFVRYRDLKIECEKLARGIKHLEKMHETASRETVKGSLPYFPYTEKRYPVVGIIHNTARIQAKKDALAEKLKEGQRLLERLMEFLKTVDDDEIKETLELYYIDCISYRKIARCFGLSGDGSTQMKKVHRYMRKVSALSAQNAVII
jgi:hypothetical protein